MIVSSYRISRLAFQNFWRNFWLSAITISMLVLTILTVNVLVVLNVVSKRAIEHVESRIELSVYFNDDVSNEKAADAADYLRSLSRVSDVGVVTSEEGLQRFKDRHVSDEAILGSLDEVDGNPFGPTLVIKAYSTADFPFIIEALDNPRFNNDIRKKDFSEFEPVINSIRKTADRIRLFGYGLTAFFLVVAILIIFNTVRMGIFIHREEIGIMKLVGASNWFVRAPFLLEGIFFSLVAVVISAAIAFPTVALLQTKFDTYFDGQSTGLVSYFADNGPAIFGAQFIILSSITLFATWVAMRKYLRA